MMQLPPLTLEQVRSIDRKAIDEYGMSGLVLMENAGRGCADKLCELGIAGQVIILCGNGNNGGDGFVIARHLNARGHDVKVVFFRTFYPTPANTRAPLALINWGILRHSTVMMSSMDKIDERIQEYLALSNPEWIVDALLGTGATGDPRSPISVLIQAADATRARKLAIDVTSGLDCDTGLPGNPTFRADHTCTFVAPKVGFANPAAKEFLGTVSVHDIGVPRKLLEEFLPK
ncbi:MAG: NAD(P)H-hydrate epimerase [Planctomycetales bacterium]|nr:NAD(P)H-hydrate epimerase [Planctomycetales bacterium]